VTVLVVPGCAASDEDAPAQDDDDGAENSSSELSVPGAWRLPADVHAAGQAQLVAYDDAPAWIGAAGCGGSLLAGTRQLGDHLRAIFPGRVTSYGGYSCRQNTADKRKTSVHGTGRALDLFVPMSGGEADNDKGDEVASWLVRNAANIGVQYIIWDRSSWQASISGDKQRGYTGPNPHIDHIHVEITNDAAARKTAFFNGSRPGGGGGGGGGGDCSVHADGRLHCTNRGAAALHADTTEGSPVVNTLRTTYSWFDCWATGERHAGGNTTWYHTLGDDNASWGFLPGVALQTPDTFDADPSAHGLRRCAR
jgi:hypothetical protein